MNILNIKNIWRLSVTMYKDTNKNNILIFYYVLYAVMMILNNNIAVLKIGVIKNVPINIGIFLMSFLFLITDIVSENYGKEESKQIVWVGFIMVILSQVFITLVYLLPALDTNNQFNNVFGLSIRVIIASFTTFLISQFIDIEVFHKLKNKFPHVKWIRNNFSTITSRTIDTAIFYHLLLFGTMPYSTLLSIIIPIFPINIALSLLDTPIFYLLTKKEAKITG